MQLSFDNYETLVKWGGGALIVLYLYKKLKAAASGLGDVVPQVVKDGAQATGLIAQLGVNAVIHPLDTFGIAPNLYPDGTPIWTQTTPWENPVYTPTPPFNPDLSSADPVSNNNQGINFNYF